MDAQGCYQTVPAWGGNYSQAVHVTINRTVPVLLGLGVGEGMVVTGVQPGGLAAQHGLGRYVGWVLSHVNGAACMSVEQVQETQTHAQTVLTLQPPAYPAQPLPPVASIPQPQPIAHPTQVQQQQTVPFYPYNPVAATTATATPPPPVPLPSHPEMPVAMPAPTPNPPLDTKRYVGIVKSFNSGTGFGFITCPELFKEHKRDVFIHKNHAAGLSPKDKVRFSIEMNKKNQPQAAFVEKLESGKKGKKKLN